MNTGTTTPNATLLQKFWTMELDPGWIQADKNGTVYVVVSSEPARWGRDQDVYGHINTWYTVRPASPDEISAWRRITAATIARRGWRKTLPWSQYRFDPQTRVLIPLNCQRLDSYDDRWEPPSMVELTPEQFTIENEYREALAAIRKTQ